MDKLLELKSDSFWRKIKTFKNVSTSEDALSKLNLDEFAKYYSILFSHNDRVSDETQKIIENDVKNMYNNSLKSLFSSQFNCEVQ